MLKLSIQEGNGGKAYGLFCQAIHISREINQSAQNVCRKLGFPVIVAPYEADAQLAFLSTSGIIDAVMTEDSDLFIFGTKELIIKLDDSGHCKVVSADQISHVDSLATFNNPIRWLRYACIMQGIFLFKTVI
jgi:exonuclease-1